MLRTLKLLLPALIPSWRFFDEIAPSPRIEFTVLQTEQATPNHWQEFRPRPTHLSIIPMFKRLFWNPQWNETLFLVSCAERLMTEPTEHSIQEIQSRIALDLNQNQADKEMPPYMQFRLTVLYREGNELKKHITFTSQPHCYLKEFDQ